MPTLPRAQAQALLPWALVAIGFAAVYIPSFIDLFNGIWATDLFVAALLLIMGVDSLSRLFVAARRARVA